MEGQDPLNTDDTAPDQIGDQIERIHLLRLMIFYGKSDDLDR